MIIITLTDCHETDVKKVKISRNTAKIYITAALIVLLCLIITVVTRTAARNIAKPQETFASSEATRSTVLKEDESIEAETEKVYLLSESDGKIAVFVRGSDIPIQITETYLRDLPELDRDKIKLGIEIHGDAALRRALEDYCS